MPATAQTAIENAPDPWVHPATQTAFPEQVGKFQRTGLIDYSGDQNDASATYRLEKGDDRLTVTLYLYPRDPAVDCQTEFAGVKDTIESRTETPPTQEGMRPSPSGDQANAAYFAAYTIRANATNQHRGPEAHTEAYLYCPSGIDWQVKYRATWVVGKTDFSADIARLMRAINWPAARAG
ncbi:hypothetical protein GRI97_03735 [Altererythrobacter xixiisoli]|uniref:Uncharacterized protein n=1 Tax=Croceibacterium xixiisoli TaxID=1476466 RepID=A0A6I4TT93_9SPHN|nr:hypothetical protein [Croceibacterium xixiisoli]MXO98097.1 hypothetical protein [Croceibacterium xixiisoli]